MAVPKGSIRNKRTGKILLNGRGEPILKGTAAAARAGYGPSYFAKGKTTTATRTRSQKTNRMQGKRTGTGTRSQSQRNTTMRATQSA